VDVSERSVSTARDTALAIWSEHQGRPYRWGGDNPSAGFDCSGLVIEGLKSVGILPRTGDWTAQVLLASVFGDKPRITDKSAIRPGMLVFWKRGASIGHVEIVWKVLDDGTILTIGASGGGSRTRTLADAQAQGAYVKVRPLVEPYAAIVDPF